MNTMIRVTFSGATSYINLKTELTSKVLLKLIQITSVEHEVMFMFIERRITYANAHNMLVLYFFAGIWYFSIYLTIPFSTKGAFYHLKTIDHRIQIAKIAVN